MSSIRIKNLPASTGVLNTDNAILSSDDLTYKLSISGMKQEFRKQTTTTKTSAAEANYNLASTDIGNILNINKTAHSTVKVTSAISSAANIGDYVDVINTNASFDVRFIADSGVSIRSRGGHTDLVDQYSSGRVTKFDTNQWLLTGDLFTSPSGAF